MEVVTRVGDTLPVLALRVADADGVAYDLTGASVDLYLFGPSGQLNIGNTACAVTEAVDGRFQYAWRSTDVSVPGVFSAYVVVRKGVAEMTLPKKDRIRITVEAR